MRSRLPRRRWGGAVRGEADSVLAYLHDHWQAGRFGTGGVGLGVLDGDDVERAGAPPGVAAVPNDLAGGHQRHG